MSIGPPEPPSADGAAEVVQEPTLESVKRRERWLIFSLGAIVATLALVGWLSIPSEATLLEQASGSESTKARIEAMNALVHRGYWAKRPPVELRVYVSQQPEEVRQFMHQMHYRLMSR